MKYLLALILVLGSIATSSAKDGFPDEEYIQEYVPEPIEVKEVDKNKHEENNNKLENIDSIITISVVGQGIAPSFATSPAQSFALAKRAATAEAYRLIAERVNGVKIDGKDTIKNMAIKSSSINTRVAAMIRNARVVETTFKDGLCEVELEIDIDKNNFK